MMALSGRVALVTGASRGIGVYVARALAEQGMHVALAARDGARLEDVRRGIESVGARALAIPVDLSDRGALTELASRVEREIGPVDVLVNNAAIEDVGAFESADPADIEHCVAVNLLAPLLLARIVLPGMLARGWGHIVNVASLAGLSANAYAEVYAATKHGLVGFTRSLRATTDAAGGARVGASVICPGFVSDVGMAEEYRVQHGVEAPAILGVSSPESVARAVVAAIREDRPDVLVNPGPTRLLMAAVVLFPRLTERISKALGVHEPFRRVAEARGRGRRT